jgi:glycosyltransferase involved in cell wall biosynthesis
VKLLLVHKAPSHFEVPLYRLCADHPELDFRTCHFSEPERVRYDEDYAATIDWGLSLTQGYEAQKVDAPQDVKALARDWGADVVLIYGYSWSGAMNLIWHWHNAGGPGLIHRGTLNYFIDPRRPVKGRLMRPLRKYIFRLFDAHHYGGAYSRRVLLDAGIPDEALFFVPYGVDTAHFAAAANYEKEKTKAAELRRLLGWEESCRVILFVAQHSWVKGPDIAMRVFAEYQKQDNKARFLIVGSGRENEAMKAFASAHLHENTWHFTGFVPSLEMMVMYLACDVVLCTSRYETWARMVNEACLNRRPCITNTRVAASGDLVINGVTGWVVNGRQVNDYVMALARHFDMPQEQRQCMSERARETALLYSYERHMDSFLHAVHFAAEQAQRRK